jgi:protein O-GlcNAc transferase
MVQNPAMTNQNFDLAKKHFLIGLDFLSRQLWSEAEAEFYQSLRYLPDRSSTLVNLCAALIRQGKFKEVAPFIERALAIEPTNPEMLLNEAVVYAEQRHYAEALKSLDRALNQKSDYAAAWFTKGSLMMDLKRHGDALAAFEVAVSLDPNIDYGPGQIYHNRMMICDWDGLSEIKEEIEIRLRSGQCASLPFPTLSLFDSPELQQVAASAYASTLSSKEFGVAVSGSGRENGKFRLAYLSTDFREHPVAHLISEVIEAHDRECFEVIGLYLGEGSNDPMTKHLENAFDKFYYLAHLNNDEIAVLCHQLGVDLAIDLGGHTKGAKPELFSRRIAPIQVNFLGFPGTWGGSCMDYIVADKSTITESNRGYFSEQVLYMPEHFQPNPKSRLSGKAKVDRLDLGLPDEAFVFCCFNNNWKINPEIFDCWMSVLREVPQAILWLYADNEAAIKNLRSEATQRGISPSRLFFANRVGRERYLAQYAVADLFLDTFPYNAGTTASDALWMGLPLLTLTGNTFASRMAASSLRSLGVPELITYNHREYVEKAIQLARQPEQLFTLREAISDRRDKGPLFNPIRFTRHLESGFRSALNRKNSGLPRQDISIGLIDFH